MKKFNVIQDSTIVRYWYDVEAENADDAEHKTIYADIPPDEERIIKSEIDVYED